MDWGSALKGAAGGALLGPMGAQIGGALGGASGQQGVGSWLNGSFRGNNEFRDPGQREDYQLPGYEQYNQQMQGLAGQYGGRQAPQAQTFNGQSQYEGGQSSLINMLMQDARGNGPGQQLARMQSQNIADRTGQQQFAMAASARPGMGAQAAQGAAFNAANAQAAVGGQAAQAGMQARLGAMGQLGSSLESFRGQDLQRAQLQAGQSQFNADARLRQMGINDQAQLQALQQALQSSQLQQQGNMAYQDARTQRFTGTSNAPTRMETLFGFAKDGLGAAARMGGGGA